MIGDPIANMINGLKNANKAGSSSVSFSYSKMKEAILKVLKDRNFVSGIEVKGEKASKTLTVALAYEGAAPKITGAKRVSKFSRRMYGKATEFKPVKNGFGLAVVSTPSGIMATEDAAAKKVGGEILCEIW